MRAGFVLKDIETGETFSYNPADVPALMRVARAAKEAYSVGFVQIYHEAEGEDYYLVPIKSLDKFREALKEVEHLLK